MITRVWFTEKVEWYVEIDGTPEEIEDMIFDGDERVWENKSFVDSVTTIDEIEVIQ